jgi:hypothetical protein
MRLSGRRVASIPRTAAALTVAKTAVFVFWRRDGV